MVILVLATLVFIYCRRRRAFAASNPQPPALSQLANAQDDERIAGPVTEGRCRIPPLLATSLQAGDQGAGGEELDRPAESITNELKHIWRITNRASPGSESNREQASTSSADTSRETNERKRRFSYSSTKTVSRFAKHSESYCDDKMALPSRRSLVERPPTARGKAKIATEIATGVAETPEKASQVNLPEDATFVI